MSDLISFDPKAATATIPLAGWPEPLADLLRLLTTVEGDALRLDFSELSDEAEHTWSHWRSDRAAFVADIEEAAHTGRLDLVHALLKRSDKLTRSTSPASALQLESLRANMPDHPLATRIGAMRDTVIAETRLDSPWLRTAMAGAYRSKVLDERDLIDVLLAQVRDADSFADALHLFRPRSEEETLVFDRLVADHWGLAQAFIAAHVGKANCYPRDPALEVVGALFLSSSTVQRARWACEQALAYAHPSTLGDWLSRCTTLGADDIRLLLQRLREGDKESLNALQPAVQKTFYALGARTGPLPADLVLAGLNLEFEFPDEAGPTRAQRQVFDRVSELPKGRWDSGGLWPQLGVEQHTVWRAELAELVGDDQALAEGLVDFACRWLDHTGYVEIEPVLRQLIDDEGALAFAQTLVRRGPRLVTLRALALIRAKLQTDTVAAVVMDGPAEPLPDFGATTWLSNPATERAIHHAMAAAEAEFCREYQSHWGWEEEFLTGELLSKARAAAKEATQQLRELGQTTKSRFPSISLDFRQPGKWEEGRKTDSGSPMGADIVFLTRLEEDGVILAERATFVQVKKRKRGKTERFSSVIEVDPEQCAHLLSQSEHAFYLFLAPPSPHPKLWVSPARLVRNLGQLHTSRSSIQAIPARDSSISFADFFLRHLVGLWSGDEREAALKIAKGEPDRGRAPRFIVEVVVRRGEG